jgi:hypothetical protein
MPKKKNEEGGGWRGKTKNTEIIWAGKKSEEERRVCCWGGGESPWIFYSGFFRVSGRVLSLAVKSQGYMYKYVCSCDVIDVQNRIERWRDT